MKFMIVILFAVVTVSTGCGKSSDGPPCERLAKALCEGGESAPCAEFIAEQNKGESEADTDKWCASIVDDSAAVKVWKSDAQKGAAGVK